LLGRCRLSICYPADSRPATSRLACTSATERTLIAGWTEKFPKLAGRTGERVEEGAVMGQRQRNGRRAAVRRVRYDVVLVVIVVAVLVPIARWCGWSPAEVVALVAAVGALRGALGTAGMRSSRRLREV
jgi:hypothetical protein